MTHWLRDIKILFCLHKFPNAVTEVRSCGNESPICVYMYVCMCMYVCMYVCMGVCVYMYVTYVCIAYICVCMCVCVQVFFTLHVLMLHLSSIFHILHHNQSTHLYKKRFFHTRIPAIHLYLVHLACQLYASLQESE